MTHDFSKVFKTPKYTGVTLSLLSMFVLASMLVVWNKLSESPSLQNSQTLQLICEKKLQGVFRGPIQAFHKETGIGCATSFLTKEEISSFLLNEKEPNSKIMLIMSENKPAIVNFSPKRFLERFTLGHLNTKTSLESETSNAVPVLCLIGKDISKPWNALAMVRYLTAPDFQNVFPGKVEYTPYSGDLWQPTQTITLYANPEIKDKLSLAINEFSSREGIQVEYHFKKLSNTSETISIIAKSEAIQYLPDMIVGYHNFKDKSGLYSTQNRFKKDCSFHISKTCKSPHSTKRLIQTIEKYF
jgi:hypothetical protein